MCGIAGQISLTSRPASWLDAGLSALQHRGPDASGIWCSSDGRVSFGHRRLAVVDLSPKGIQPMRRKDFCITFNGEIYNAIQLRRQLSSLGVHFCSRSDTEVILAAYEVWGVAGLERLEGMFAFATHDANNGVVHFMRDRTGEKPFFYCYVDGTFRFASELKGLLVDSTLPRRIDSEALESYLAMGFVPGARCLLEGFSKLPPAHHLRFDLFSGNFEVRRYWEPPLPDVSGSLSIDSLAAELDSLLAASVERQLVADVPVGVMLSGGVDSSLITAFACRARKDVRTFSVSFPGSARYDESKHARFIADYFRTEHTEIQADSASVELLPLFARQYDEPIIDSSMVPMFLVSQCIRQYCTVAIGGDGADELFGGYKHYSRLLKLQQFSFLPLLFRRGIRAAVTRWSPVGIKGRNWIQALGSDLSHEVPLIASYFDQRHRQLLLNDQISGFHSGDLDLIRTKYLDQDLVHRATRLDFDNYLPEDILVKVDRASMLNSLEVRSPMLDREVVEFAFRRVSSVHKTTTSGRKLLLKELARRLLPSGFDFQRKQGFSIPLSSWLEKGPWREYFLSILLDA